MKYLVELVQEANKPATSIIDLMMKNVGGFYPSRGYTTIHASDITKDDFCPRKVALIDTSKLENKEEYIGTALKATFDVGNMTAHLFKNQWAGQHIWGNWTCVRCRKAVSHCKKPTKTQCASGGHCSWEYEEIPFVCTETAVSGSLDALMDLGASKLFITELKIIRYEDFAKLVAPLAEHRIRTNLYMRIVEKSASAYHNRINLQEARVLYISRGFGKKSDSHNEILPFKEFVVKRDDEALIPYLDKAQRVNLFRKTGKMPYGICTTMLSPFAKGCPVSKLCFSGKFPVTQ